MEELERIRHADGSWSPNRHCVKNAGGISGVPGDHPRLLEWCGPRQGQEECKIHAKTRERPRECMRITFLSK